MHISRFARAQMSINKPEPRRIFEVLSRRIRIQWNFRKEILNEFSETPAFQSFLKSA